MHRSISFVVGLVSLAAIPVSAQSRDQDSSKREVTVSTEGATLIVIEAEAGSLRVNGRSGIREARASGIAWAGSNRRLEEIKLTGERRGTEVYIIVDIPDDDDDRWDDDDQAMLDLTVDVPDNIPVDIEDGSGEVEVMGRLRIVDGSGSLRIENIGGPLKVTDGSGELRIERVRGDVTIRDGSGDIEVRDVQGSLTIEGDGSGEIDVQQITGRVHVEADGSGSIDARNIGGDFVVDRKGSGGIRYADVRGAVRIPANKRDQ
jgi:hypothetical protein